MGRFATQDTWAGNGNDPISLHKYSYSGDDPVNYWDPTGHYTQNFGYAVEAEIEDQYRMTHPYCGPVKSRGICYFGSRQYYSIESYFMPDIMDWSERRFAEIKPFTLSGITKGALQLKIYSETYGRFAGFTPNTTWTPVPASVQGVPTYFVNAGGVIFYTDDASFLREFYAVGLATASWTFRRYATSVATRLGADAAARALLNSSVRALMMSRTSQLVGQTGLAVTARL